jgi:hypothetical protein
MFLTRVECYRSPYVLPLEFAPPNQSLIQHLPRRSLVACCSDFGHRAPSYVDQEKVQDMLPGRALLDLAREALNND